MTFAELPYEERAIVQERIEGIIGSKKDCVNDQMDVAERIRARKKYDDTFKRMTTIYIKYGMKALSMTYTDEGWRKSGITPNGKKWALEMNCGMEERSRYCGTLFIDGEMVFTSGRIEKAFEYILNN